jgi:uncharacterized protein YwqG
MAEVEKGRKYNFIYKKLVESEDDLVGLVAYGIYKQHKIAFINDFKENYKREPSASEIEIFFLTSTTSDQLKKYKDKAESLVSEIVSNTILEEIQSFENDMLNKYEEKIEKAVKNNIPSNTKNIIIGTLGSLVGAIILTIMTIGFYFAGNTIDKNRMKDVKELIENHAPNSYGNQPSDSIKF